MNATLHKIIILCQAKQASDCRCDQCGTLRGIVKLCEAEIEAQKAREQAAEQLYQIVTEQILEK